MTTKRTIITIIIVLFVLNIYPSVLIRHNQLGYFINGYKNLVVMSDENITGNKWTISDSAGKVLLNGSLVNPIKSDSIFTPANFNYKIDFSSLNIPGIYKYSINNNHHCKIKISPNPINNVLSDNLKFIKVHRAGISEVEDRKTAHVEDSACNIMRKRTIHNNKDWFLKSEDEKVDLYGGWYDGFSYIKFTLTNAYTAYLLLRAYEENPKLFNSNSQSMADILVEAQWGLEYLCKLFPSNDDFIIEVGDFSEDHNGIRLPEMDKMNGKRLAYSALSKSHMGLTVAALSTGSRIFKSIGNEKDAKRYLNQAIKIYSKAKNLKIGTIAWVEGAYALHKDDTENDNLLLAAIELYVLTKDTQYLKDAQKYSLKAKNKYYCSYSMLHFPAQVRAMEFIPQAKKFIKEDIESFLGYANLQQNIWSKPLEFSHSSNYSSLAIASAFLKYSEILNSGEYNQLCFDVYDYLYGKNNWGKSFVVTGNVSHAVKNVRSQIYILQKRKTPLGAVISGPCDSKSHKEQSVWCFFDPRSLDEHPFNTKRVKYYDHSDDLMCNESMIYGVAEAIYFQSLLSKITNHQES